MSYWIESGGVEFKYIFYFLDFVYFKCLLCAPSGFVLLQYNLFLLAMTTRLGAGRQV